MSKRVVKGVEEGESGVVTELAAEGVRISTRISLTTILWLLMAIWVMLRSSGCAH